MAGGTIYFDVAGKAQVKIDWWSTSNGSSANSSNVNCAMYMRRYDGYTTTGTFSGTLEIGGNFVSVSKYETWNGDWKWIGSYNNCTIYHDSNGTKSIWIGASISNTDTSLAGTWSGGQWCTLDTIPRYLAFTGHSTRARTINSISINWSTDSARDWTQYSLNGGTWTDANDTLSGTNSGYYTISNLNPNTTYTVKTRCRRTDSGLWTESSTLTITTYDIAKISSASNFNLGDSVNVGITNPGNVTATLEIKVNDTKIKEQNLSTGTNTITFTDTELDNIYKQFKNTNTVTATYTLTSNDNSNWKNSKTVTCTLTGNQKTIKINMQNEWKRGKIWKNENGTWKRAVIWINVQDTWKRGI